MIELKLKEMLDSISVLRELAQKQLKGRVAYRVAKLLKKVEEEFTLFNDSRQKVVDTYGERDENGNLAINPETNEYVFSDENFKLVTDEINAILDNTVTINANKLQLTDIEDLDFTPAEMVALTPFIEE